MFKDSINESNIHSYLDGGFVKDTQIEVEDGNSVSIQDIEVDDVLHNGEIVTGIVEIDATNLSVTGTEDTIAAGASDAGVNYTTTASY